MLERFRLAIEQRHDGGPRQGQGRGHRGGWLAASRRARSDGAARVCADGEQHRCLRCVEWERSRRLPRPLPGARRNPAAPRARRPRRGHADTSNNLAISESSASRQSAGTGAVDSAQAGATGADASSGGSTLNGAQTAATQPQGGSPGAGTGSNAAAEHGVAGRAGAGSGDSNSTCPPHNPIRPPAPPGTPPRNRIRSVPRGAQAGTAALSDGTRQGADAASRGGSTAGATNGAAAATTAGAAGEGGAGLNQATGATTTANADKRPLGPPTERCRANGPAIRMLDRPPSQRK